jgi:hypothetical protein
MTAADRTRASEEHESDAAIVQRVRAGDIDRAICKYMERTGIEPATSWLQIKT